MKPLPSDYKILRLIYNEYYDEFSSRNMANEKSKVHISIDIKRISSILKVEPEIVFGRLYYYLNHKFGYEQDNGAMVQLFAVKVGEDRHAVNFPLLGSVLASMKEEQSMFVWATGLSIVAVVISIVSAVVSHA